MTNDFDALEKRCFNELSKLLDFDVGFAHSGPFQTVHSDSTGIYYQTKYKNIFGLSLLGGLAILFSYLIFRAGHFGAPVPFAVGGVVAFSTLCLLFSPLRCWRKYLLKDGIVIADEDERKGIPIDRVSRFIFCTIPPGVPMLGGLREAAPYYIAFAEDTCGTLHVIYFSGVGSHVKAVRYMAQILHKEYVEATFGHKWTADITAASIRDEATRQYYETEEGRKIRLLNEKINSINFPKNTGSDNLN